jgi:hypothetical protein
VFDFDRNARRVLVSQLPTGPQLTVSNRYIGSIVTSTTSTTLLDLPAGVPMSFTIEATAESYGSRVVGYRYGWDILDLNDDDQWAIDYTPLVGRAITPAREHYSGTHSFYAQVIDDSGLTTLIIVTINIIKFSMDRDLLLVDDWDERSAGFTATSGALPSDAEHDQFWSQMLGDVRGFAPGADVIDVAGRPGGLLIQDIADYRNIIWSASGAHSNTSASFLSRVIRFVDPNVTTSEGRAVPNLVALFMAAGGHVLLCGDQVMTMAINRASFSAAPPVFPLIFRYELAGDQDGWYEDSDIGVRGVGDDSFAYDECCLNVIDIAYILAPTLVRSGLSTEQRCSVQFLRDHGHDIGAGQRDGLRAARPLDLTTGGGFPRLEIRSRVQGDPEVHSDAERYYYHVDNIGLNCDIYNPRYFSEQTPCGTVTEYDDRDCLVDMFGIECANRESVIFGATIGFWTTQLADRVPNSGGKPARSAVWGFHPVYFNPDQVKESLDIILFTEWGLERGALEKAAP